MLKSAGLIFISHVVTMVVLFLRNVLVARLISVEDFGIAVNFAIAFAFLENATYVGLQRMIVQDKEGNSPHFQYALHLFQLIRGVIALIVGLLLAGPYAAFLGIPEVGWAFMVLATLPLIRSFQHLDIFRYQREMRFGAEAFATVASPIVSLVVALVVYLFSADYQMMLWAIMIQQIFHIVLTHVLAERPFGLAWDPVIMRRALGFGLPLMANGLLLFAFANGERVIVGAQLGLEVLGWFSAGYMLVQAGSALLKRTLNSLMLPKLSAAHDNIELRDATLQLSMVLGMALLLGTVIVGPWFLVATFGPDYVPVLGVLIILGLVQMVLILKSGVVMVAMSRGDTLSALYSNMPSLAYLPVGYLLLQNGYGLLALLYVGLVSELVGLALALWLVRARHGVSLRAQAVPGVFFGLTFVWVLWLQSHVAVVPQMPGAGEMVLVVLCGCVALSSRALLRYAVRWLKSRKSAS